MNFPDESISINATPEAVFDYVTDIKKHPEWAAQPMEMEVEGDGGPGTKFRSVVKFMGKTAGTGEVIAVERPSRFVYECEDNGGRYRWTMSLRSQDGGTLLTHSCEQLSAPLYIKVIQPVLYRVFGKKMTTGGLANIKARVETGQRAS